MRRPVPAGVARYMSQIGRAGGRASRRRLASEDARNMVRVREARRAYRRFHTQCFWSSPADYRVGLGDLEWVVERLRTYGGREGWELAARLCR